MRLEKLSSSVRRGLGRAAGAIVLTVASSSSMAAILCSPAAVLIPENVDGVYLNLVTGAQGSSGAAVPNWDVNLYLGPAATPTALFFFWPTAPTDSFGGVATGTVYDALAAGAPIGSGQVYSVASGGGGAAPYANWHAGQTGRYLGVRFFNETTSSINFGWLQLNTGSGGANPGYPATINQYCYDDTGAQISAGTTPVALQAFSVD